MAAARLGVPEDSLRDVDGVIQPQAGGAGLSYAELVAGGQVQIKLHKDATPKDLAAYRHVGQSVPRLDIPAKCTRGFIFMQDFRFDGMLHGRVVRSSAIGADLQYVDEASVQSLPGVIKVVRDGNFLGVVAWTEWGATKVAEAQHATWSQPQTLADQAKLREHLRSTKAVTNDVTCTIGDPSSHGQPGPPADQRDRRLPDPHPWLHLPVLRRGGRTGRQGDGLERLVDDVPAPQAGCGDAAACERGRALPLL